MEQIGNLIQQSLFLKRPKSPRAVLIKEIADKLKAERDEKPYYYKGEKKIKLKHLTDRQIAIRCSHYKDLQQLEDLYSSCKHAKNFTKTFWAITRTKKL